jgi:hypothetical protein
MKNKLVISSVILASACSVSFAGNFYLAPDLYIERIASNHSSYSDIHPQLAVGYGAMRRNIFIAGELFFTPVYADISNNHNKNTYSSRITSSFGASFIPGFMINNTTMGFARLGMITSRFKSPGTFTTGGQIGLGIQSIMIDNWSLRGEYNFTAYRKVGGFGSPKSNELGFGLVYTFDKTKENKGYY